LRLIRRLHAGVVEFALTLIALLLRLLLLFALDALDVALTLLALTLLALTLLVLAILPTQVLLLWLKMQKKFEMYAAAKICVCKEYAKEYKKLHCNPLSKCKNEDAFPKVFKIL
jgi:hypothetical protein